MKLAVICPTFNSARLIGRSLQSWLRQDFPEEALEVFIIDKNSTDNTKDIIAEISKNQVKYIAADVKPSAARNTGVKLANANTVLFFDDDSVAEPDHFKNGLKFLEEHPEIDIVGGPQVDSPHDGFFAKSAGAAMGSFFGSFTMAQRYKKTKANYDADEFSLTSANIFVRKKVFDKIGGFDESIYPGEDPEFFARAKKNDVKMAFLPEIAIQHSRRPTLKLFCKQHYKYGYNRVFKERLSKTPFPQNLLFCIPSLFLIYLLMLPFIFLLNKFFAFPALIYVAGSCIFAAEAAAYKKNWLALPLVPFLFLAMHLSYGAGFLHGLLKTKI